MAMTPLRQRRQPRAAGRLAAIGLMLACATLKPLAAHAQQDATLTDDAIHAHIEKIVGFGVRVPGSAASRAASDYVRDEFVRAGLEGVRFQEAETLVWQASSWGLAVEGRPVPASPMLHTFHNGQPGVFSTGSQGRQAPLVYIGKGTAWDFLLNDVRGKIVVADVPFSKRPLALFRPFLIGVQDAQGTFPWDYRFVDPYSGGDFPGNYDRAMKAGAAGFVGILVDYFDSHRYRNEAYRSYDPGSAMSLPAMWLSPVDGAALVEGIRAAGRKRPVMATMKLEGMLTKQTGRGVYGFLPGMSDETVLIQSHHDSTTAGAVEDASGAAEVLALARHFAQLPRTSRPRTLMFATMDTHFTDYAVHKAFAKQHLRAGNPEGRMRPVKAS